MSFTWHVSIRSCSRWFAACLVALVLATLSGVAQGAGDLACGPSQLGAPCGNSGPATQPLGEGPGLGAGNPVNVATGNKYQHETDMPALPGELGLELVRHYNSFDTRQGPWGTGWTLSYDTRLYRVGNSLQIVQADGSRLSFAAMRGSTLCMPENPAYGTLHVLGHGAGESMPDEADGQSGYVWTWRSGRVLRFDPHGRLIRIENVAGQAVSIERGRVPGHASYRQVLRVRDPAGRTLAMHYATDTGAVLAVTTPAGVLQYNHVDDRLQAVIYPDGHWRGYLYEPRHQAGGMAKLTGIVAGRPALQAAGSWTPEADMITAPDRRSETRRLNTWIYDARGRVVTSIPGTPEQLTGRIDIQYGEQTPSRRGRGPGKELSRVVTVRDDQKRETRFHLGVRGGRHVVLKLAGHGCAGCPPAGASMEYDVNGNAASMTGLAAVRDGLGRVIQLGSQPAVQVQWWQDSSLPQQIRMPSVVPDHQHVVNISWQQRADGGLAQAVPVLIEETGWRPGQTPQSISRRIDLQWAGAGATLQAVRSHGPVTAMMQRQAPDHDGWPGFSESVDDFGNVVQWHSNATGTEWRSYDDSNRLHERRFANGTTWRYAYDEAGRLVRMQAMTGRPSDNGSTSLATPQDGGQRDEVDIMWRGEFPVRIANRYEEQQRVYSEHGHLAARRITRPADAGLLHPDTALDYSERFERDAAGRVRAHFLPEGGALFYDWGPAGALRGIAWLDSAGHVHTLLGSVPGQQGYTQSNGVRLQSVVQKGRLAGMAFSHQDRLIWAQRLRYDTSGRIAAESTRHAGNRAHHESYGYDAESRLVVTTRDWHAWGQDGSLLRRRDAHAMHAAPIRRDASGLPLQVGQRALQYGANRRLVEVREGDRLLAVYQHNAFGERIARHDEEGVTHFLFDENRVVAEWRANAAHAGVLRRYVYAQGVPVALIQYATLQPFRGPSVALVRDHDEMMPSSQTQLYGAVLLWAQRLGQAFEALPRKADVYAIHSDAIGLPRVVTDSHGRIRWAAEYSPFGMAKVMPGSLDMPLRLPGQVFDAATGWHDNYLRTYDPHAGHYLEPDPLGVLQMAPGGAHGLAPVTSAFGYAAQQPRRYADPLGLVLFAFDGTREDLSTATNIYQMALLYRNAEDVRYGQPDIYYQPGPGDPGRPDLDAATAGSADMIVATQWSRLLQHLAAFQSSSEAVSIDLVGYSRGASLARHFANQLVQNTRGGRFWQRDARSGTVTACIDLRFMGLFDSVAQFGLLGSRNHEYDFSIAPDWAMVAHAVALHEHRSLFPLMSAADASGRLPTNVLEQAFVGAHGDIGGGLVQRGNTDQDTHDLSDVALVWMLEMARRAGVTLDAPQAAQNMVTDPVLHDMRGRSQRVAQRLHEAYGESPAWPRSDREVRSATDTQLVRYQGDHAHYGAQAREQAEAFIRRIADWTDSSEPVVGIVDMDAYAAWLASH